MNKILLLAALAASSAFGAMADVQVYSCPEGKPETLLEPGKTFIWNDLTIEDQTEYEMGYFVVGDPKLYLRSDNTTVVDVTAKCTTKGQTVQLCCGGQCEVKTEVVKRGVTIAAGKDLPMDLEWTADEIPSIAEIPTDVTVEITVAEGSQTNNYTVIFNAKEGGVKDIIDNAVAADAAVYNLSGVKVAQGSVANLPAGIYIVKNGTKARKVLVK